MKSNSAKGKVPASLFEQAIAPRLGRKRPELVHGPQIGLDNAVITLNETQVLIATTDPFFIVPEFGWKRAAWFAVHIIASDAATSGIAPAYMSIDLNLPPEMSENAFGQLWTAIHEVCKELGIGIVAGHTGWYDGCSYPMLGGATIFAVGNKDTYVTPSMAQPGDIVLMTKGAAIETTGIMGVMFSDKIEAALGREVASAAAAMFDEMSVVRDALTAVSIGVRENGVTGMHDATERGLFGALCEIAEVSKCGMLVDKQAIHLQEATRQVCELFGIDPYSSSSEGTLVLTCKAGKKSAIASRLKDAGVDVFEIGEMLPREKGVRIVESGNEISLEPPTDDPFWPAYLHALKEKGTR